MPGAPRPQPGSAGAPARPAGRQDLVDAVEGEKFPRVIVRGDDTGNPAQNEAQRTLVSALKSSDSYTLERPGNGWRVFTRIEGSGG